MSGVTEFMWGEPFGRHIAHLRQQCHNSKFVIFREKLLKVLKCYNFLWMQQRHNCPPVVSFTYCVMTLYLLKVHLQTFLSVPKTQKCQILSCDTLVTNERYHNSLFISCYGIFLRFCLLYIIVYWCWWHIRSNVINSIHMRQTFGNFNKNEHTSILHCRLYDLSFIGCSLSYWQNTNITISTAGTPPPPPPQKKNPPPPFSPPIFKREGFHTKNLI